MLDKIHKHRIANGLNHATGWEEEVLGALCRSNPHLRCEEANAEPHRIVVEGRAAWKALHEYALTFDEENLSEAQQNAKAWLVDWRRTIPRTGCQCRDKFQRIESAHPVDLSSREAFWRWTILIHNVVSESLGKEQFTLEQAQERWISSSG